MNQPLLRLACVDDHAVVREGIQAHLRQVAPEIVVAASTESVEELMTSGIPVDVALVDLRLREDTSLPWIPRLLETGARIALYTTEERPVPLREAVAAGVSGVLLKSDPLHTVVDGIRMVARGEFVCSGPLAHALITDESLVVELSDQQRQVLQCLDEGLDYRATGRVLGISEGTVKTYLARIREKFRSHGLEAGNSHQLTKHAQQQGHLR